MELILAKSDITTKSHLGHAPLGKVVLPCLLKLWVKRRTYIARAAFARPDLVLNIYYSTSSCLDLILAKSDIATKSHLGQASLGKVVVVCLLELWVKRRTYIARAALARPDLVLNIY